MTFQRAAFLCLRWPYQAKVMKMFEIVKRTNVLIGVDLSIGRFSGRDPGPRRTRSLS